MQSDEKEVVSGEVITGTEGANTLTGTDGNDTFDGKGGDDNIDGGRGIDTVLIFDNAYSFKVVSLAGTTKVYGKTGSDYVYLDEIITMRNVEKIQFADQTISLSGVEK